MSERNPQKLWNRLAAMTVTPPDAALSFTDRLAKEQGWQPAFTDRVMREYRRFLFLAATGPTPVSPSLAVDAAWHLHLTYTRHYWDELCGRILGKPLHHDPTEGGAAEDGRHERQYDATIAAYRAAFGEAPPVDIWPRPEERPASKPRRVKAVARLAIIGGVAFQLAACAMFVGATGPRPIVQADMIGVLIVVGVIAAISTVIGIAVANASPGKRRGSNDGGASGSNCGGGDSSSDSSDGGSSCGSSCGGGCGGGGGGD